jgi:hypothetical protein
MFNLNGKFVDEEAERNTHILQRLQTNFRSLESIYSPIIYGEIKFLISQLPEYKREEFNKRLNQFAQ